MIVEYVHIHKHIMDLDENDDIYRLLREIEMVVQEPLSIYRHNDKSQVIHFLKDFRSKRPIDKIGMSKIPFPKECLLNKKISKLNGTDIFELCREIAAMKGESIENCGGHTLYVFLDRFLKDGTRKKKVLYPCTMSGRY